MNHLKPLAKPYKMPLIQQFKGSSLTLSAAEALLSAAEMLSEGAVSKGENGPFYTGSTLITIDLSQRFNFGGKANLDTLVGAVSRSVALRLGLMRLARREAERRCTPHFIREMDMETEFRVDGERLFIDIDVECPLAGSYEMEDEG